MAAFTISDAARLSHAYTLASPDRAECLNLAGQIAAAAVCQREKDAPCGERHPPRHPAYRPGGGEQGRAQIRRHGGSDPRRHRGRLCAAERGGTEGVYS